MPVKPRMNTVQMVSVHDDYNSLRLDMASQLPPWIMIPSTVQEATEVARLTRLEYIDRAGGSLRKPFIFYYAEKRKDATYGDYILLRIPDMLTVLAGSAQQEKDEWNHPLFPDIQRSRLVVFASDVVNQIEAMVGKLGVIGIEGDEPKADELKKALKLNSEYKRLMVERVTKAISKYGPQEVTEQAMRWANQLYRASKIQVLPDWAVTTSPEGSKNQQLCPSCQSPVRKGSIRCQSCAAVQPGMWKKGVDDGIILPRDVPPSRLKEAGLLKGGKSQVAVEVPVLEADSVDDVAKELAVEAEFTPEEEISE